MSKPPMFVSRPSLPPLGELLPYLEQIWDSKVLTNGGPFHKQLETALCDYLGVPYISLFSNGTMGLITALKALNVTGEVITTPYSFVATASALHWSNITPVFVDIDPTTLNLDPSKIEASITPRTTAIMPVHVYGHPCDVDAIEAIAKRHDLKVIYDAAHAFGVRCHCGSVLKHGDLSVLSFHATKVFNTFEGGAIVSPDAETKYHIDTLKNFGFENEFSVNEIGINGKMNEFSSALGLLQLERINEQIEERKVVDGAYREGLTDIAGIRCHIVPKSEKHNFNYFPIFVEDSFPLSTAELYENLRKNNILARRYFYPLISDFTAYKNSMFSQSADLNISRRISSSVICLPIYSDMTVADADRVVAVIKKHSEGTEV